MDPLDLPSERSIDFRTSFYFPVLARLGGCLLVAFGLLAAMANLIVGAIFLCVGIFVATSHYRVKIDFGRNQYKEYSWIFGLKFGDTDHFDQIEYIYVNKNKVTQSIAARVASTSFQRNDYNAYIKFSERHKVHLRSDGDKKYVFNYAKKTAARLKCQVVDRTGE